MRTSFAKYFTRYLLLLVSFLYAQNVASQEKSYTHYDVSNGLAGSTIYSMIQDKEGFIWLGTETGLSRFDGTHFKTFGTEDGMPDNEILKIFQDSKGRIWMIPFKKAVCYYYKGEFHTSENDSLIKKIHPTSNLLDVAEDSDGNILLQESDYLHVIKGANVSFIKAINGVPIHNCLGISRYRPGGFMVVFADKLWQLKNGIFSELMSLDVFAPNYHFVSMNDHLLSVRASYASTLVIDVTAKSQTLVNNLLSVDHYQFFGDTMLVGNGETGSYFSRLNASVAPRQFLPNKSINTVLADNEGNYWFATRGDGVYKLSSENVSHINLFNEAGRKLGAYGIAATPRKWVIASDLMNVFQIFPQRDSTFKSLRFWDEFSSKPPARAIAVAILDNEKYLLGSDMVLEQIPFPQKEVERWKLEMAVKAIAPKSAGEFLVASNQSVISIQVPDFLVKDTFWNERATTVYYYHDTVLVGTLDGLYLIANNKSRSFAGKNEPLLRNRINAMCAAGNDVLWIATDGAGMIAYKNGRVIQRITVQDGLTSNNCRTLWTDKDSVLWIGTDKGLNWTSLSSNQFRLGKMTASDGLSSNVISAVVVQGDSVIIATPEGIDFFDKRRISFHSRCNLVLDKILVSNHEMNVDARSFTLPHRDNNIHFSFAGISFRSGGDMRYQYRLIGLDSTWKTTKENFLDYPTLPSGDYALELFAVNQFNIKSNLLTIPFSIQPLLTEKTWFRAVVYTAILILTGLFVYWLVTRVRKRENQKNEINRRMAELEQLALKSQMNPHFIFNCLNSIQQFVLDKDVAGSNRFITGFSRLIRQTLDISAKKEITLAEEIIYLSTYLELEKTRFEGKFKYEVRVTDDINVNDYMIPPMMLQPFVENSIRHGIRYRKDDDGRIVVAFEKSGEDLVCIVEDNGIGRHEATRLKSTSPIEYQSKGMSLIASRIQYMNDNTEQPITLNVEDLLNDAHESKGTRVVLKFPLINTH